MDIFDKANNILNLGRCELCGGRLRDPGLDHYVCCKCGHEQLSEFGLIKEFIKQNGRPTIVQIAQGTGIPAPRIEKYLREGRVEIPEDSDIFIPCLNCGTDIRYGKYCAECAAQLSKQLRGVMITPSEVGEKPKKKGAKMRFLD